MSKFTISELMNKNREQLNKELNRRGLTINWYSKEEAIRAIIEHDAYYEGVNDARKNCVKNGKPGVVCAVAVAQVEPQRDLYCFIDVECLEDEPTIMALTPEQANFVNTLKEHSIVYDTIEMTKIRNTDIIRP